ncbi:MAG: protein kinase [Proteobacteria bacterium]|nr:protein kinase [Pseudomonadota bacterium]
MIERGGMELPKVTEIGTDGKRHNHQQRGSATWFTASVEAYDAEVMQLRGSLAQHGIFCERGRLGERSSWLHFHPKKEGDMPAAFWKAHLSLHPERVLLLFHLLELFANTVPVGFKLPLNLYGYLFLHNSVVPELLFGKTVTFYPTSEEELHDTVEFIEDHWRDDASPKILGDLYCSGNPSLGIRWGEYSAQAVNVDLAGRPQRLIPLPSGTLGYDVRSPTSADKQQPTPVELCGRLWRPFDLCASSSAGKQFCDYTLLGSTGAWFNGSFCATGPDGSLSCIKFAHHFGMISVDGLTAQERALAHVDVAKRLQHEGLLPMGEIQCRRSDHFVFVQYPWVQGFTIENSLHKLSLHQLIKIGMAISRLHEAGFVHRDIKPSNIVANDSGSEFACIDFDLSVLEGTMSSDLGGSVGYRPPEYLSSDIITRSYDTFSFGTLVFQALTGHIPTDAMPNDLIKILLDVNGWGALGASLLRSRHSDPVCRPSIPGLCSVLHRAHLRARKHTRGGAQRLMQEARDAIVLAASMVTSSDLQGDNLVKGARISPPDISIYSGVAGMAFALESLGSHAPDVVREPYLRHAKTFLSKITDSRLPPGFFVGRAGVVIALEAMASDPRNSRSEKFIRELLSCAESYIGLDVEEPSLFFGQAGLLFAAALLGAETMITNLSPQLRLIAQSLVSHARSHNGQVCWVPSGSLDGSRQPTNGLFHGTAGIALGLGCYGAWVGEQKMCDIANAAMEGLCDKLTQRCDSELPLYVTKPIGTPAEHSLSHGLPGFTWSLIRLRHVIKPEIFSLIYPQVIDHLLRTKISGPTSWAHGLAGIVDLFIDILSLDLGYRSQDVSSYLEDCVRALLAIRKSKDQVGPERTMALGFGNGLAGRMRVLARWIDLREDRPAWKRRLFDPCEISPGLPRVASKT